MLLVFHRGRGEGVAGLALSARVLRSLDFGAPAAERDIGRGLEKYFVESAAYQRVRCGAKTIILGNRGAGKSAIFKVLASKERSAGSVVIELAPEDYSYELLSSTLSAANAGSWAKHGGFAVAWKYLIYVLIMKELTAKGLRAPKSASMVIYKYLRDHHYDPQMGRMALLVSYLKRLDTIKVGPLKAGFKAQELEKLYRLEEINSLLPYLKEILAHKRVVILVDELDRGWDASDDAKAFVSGLFQACASINGFDDNLRAYISLRQELYDNIPALYEDAQKYRDLVEVINWTGDSLLKLIAKRIRHCALENGYSPEALAHAGDAACWRAVFATPPGYPANTSFRYMLDRTLHRPREIIQFCAETVEAARERTAQLPLPYAAISWTERAYSAERAKDIAAEYRFQYPGLLSVFDAFRGRGAILSRASIELLSLELATGEIPTSGTKSWLHDHYPDDVIEILWHVGFLTAYSNGSRKPRHDERSSFWGFHQVQHLNLAAVQRFAVHPMFRAYLGVKEDVNP